MSNDFLHSDIVYVGDQLKAFVMLMFAKDSSSRSYCYHYFVQFRNVDNPTTHIWFHRYLD